MVPIKSDDGISIDSETGELVLGVGHPEQEQQRVVLAERLWRRLPSGA